MSKLGPISNTCTQPPCDPQRMRPTATCARMPAMARAELFLLHGERSLRAAPPAA